MVNPPRQAAAKRFADRIRAMHRDTEIVPYAWHPVTHAADDVANRGSRVPPGSPPQLGHLRDTQAVSVAWEVTTMCARAMQARRIVIETPPSFSPGALSRERLTRFVEHLDSNLKLVWAPQGLWTPATALELAQKLGILLMWPAHEADRPIVLPHHSEHIWVCIEGVGRSKLLRPALAESIAETWFNKPPLAAVFAGPRAYGNLRTFAAARASLR